MNTDERITIHMQEVISYSRTFTIAELAAVLGVEDTHLNPDRFRGNVLSLIDVQNNYGLAAEQDEALMDALVPPGDTCRYVVDVTDREWNVTR